MKRRALAVILCAVMACTLAACGSKSTTSNNTAENTTGNNTVKAVVLEDDYVSIGQYSGLTYTSSYTPMTDDAYQEAVTKLLTDNGTKEEVKDRDTTKTGDDIVFDFTGKIDGKAFDNGSATDYEAVIGETGFIDGFDDNLVGHKVGETYDFNITFPDNYGDENLNGKEATFTITIKKINQTVPAELTDDFCKTYTDYDTVDDFNANYRTDLDKANAADAENTDKDTLWNQVMDSVTVKKYDDESVASYNADITSYYQSMAGYYGYANNTMSNFYTDYMGMTEEEFAQQCKEYAQNLATEDKVVALIAKKEGLELTDADLTDGYNKFASNYNMAQNEVDNYFGDQDSFKTELLYEKVVSFVYDHATAVAATETSNSTNSTNSVSTTVNNTAN